MSSQRGNVSRSRKQKYQNSSSFRNDLHDKSDKTKMIKNLTVEGICQRCKDIIDWKIKYKKYKPLTQPATCVRCRQKTVKRAYYTVCQPCATEAGVCAKCNAKKQPVIRQSPSDQEKLQQDREIQLQLKQLKERERRTYFRHLENGDEEAAKATLEGRLEADDSFGFSDDEDSESDVKDCDGAGAASL